MYTYRLLKINKPKGTGLHVVGIDLYKPRGRFMDVDLASYVEYREF